MSQPPTVYVQELETGKAKQHDPKGQGKIVYCTNNKQQRVEAQKHMQMMNKIGDQGPEDV